MNPPGLDLQLLAQRLGIPVRDERHHLARLVVVGLGALGRVTVGIADPLDDVLVALESVLHVVGAVADAGKERRRRLGGHREADGRQGQRIDQEGRDRGPGRLERPAHPDPRVEDLHDLRTLLQDGPERRLAGGELLGEVVHLERQVLHLMRREPDLRARPGRRRSGGEQGLRRRRRRRLDPGQGLLAVCAQRAQGTLDDLVVLHRKPDGNALVSHRSPPAPRSR